MPLNGIVQTIAHDLTDHAVRRPDARALAIQGETLTFRDLDGLSTRAAACLRAAGVRPGHVVALTMTDQTCLAVAMLATIRLGATIFSIPGSAMAHQRAEMAARATASVLATDAADGRFDAGIKRAHVSREDLGAWAEDRDTFYPTPEAPCLLIHGSGSTGLPRFIAISYRQSQARAATVAHYLRLGPNDLYMLGSGLEFATPKSRLFAALSAGAGFALADARDMLSSILTLRPSVLHLSVFHAERLLREAQARGGADLSFIRVLSVGASMVSEDLRRRLRQDLKANLHIHYGTNESQTIGFALPADVEATPGTVGRPPEGVAVEIVDAAHQPLPPGRVGQVRVRGPSVIGGYWDTDAAGNFRDGWFYPGDLARWSEDGQLIFYGRADHLMIMNGINIYPAEIERAVGAHPAVRDAAAMPLRHEVHQDVPICAVGLHPGVTASPAEIEAFARERLGVRGPRHVFVVDEIPRNEQGKLERARLADLVRDALARRTAPRQQTAETTPAQHGSQAHRHGRRQLTRGVSFTFTLPPGVQPVHLDAWLAVLCEPSGADEPPAAPASSPVLRWLDAVLLLARQTLKVARFPLLDRPRILACRPGPVRDGAESWHATAAFPYLEHLPARIYDLALQAAMQAARFAAETPVTEETRQAMFARLESGPLARLRRLSGHGKSTLPVLEAAHARGIPFAHLGGGFYQLGWGARARRIDRSTIEADSAMGMRLSTDKVLTVQLLGAAGLPHPQQAVVRSVAEASAAAQRIGWPVVVKPADRERGEGVSVDITTDAALEAAFEGALKLSPSRRVIVERQVAGVCHRLFMAHGRLLYAVKRLPMGVWADGVRPVRTLVDDACRRQRQLPPWARSEILPIDDLARAAMQAEGLDEASVPAEGRFVPLRRIETTAWGGIDEDVTGRVHPDNLRAAAAAARLFGLQVAGIDIITPDIGVSWNENGAIINEVNFAPLLGGGEISRRHIPAFLDALIEGDGRIPVHVHVGGAKAAEAAEAHRQRLAADGHNAALTSAERTVAPSGADWPMAFAGLHRRCCALILSPEVDALVLLVDTDELLKAGLPLEAVSTLHDTGEPLLSHRSGTTLPPAEADRLRRVLHAWAKGA